MIRLYAEQLGAQLQESLRPCYLLFGNDPLLLQESQDGIRDRAQEQQFDEHFSVTLDAGTDWDAIFSLCQARSLFASRQTLLLVLPDGGVQAACQLLCYCYEGNLLALAQALERLSLIYPDGSLTLPRVDAAVNDAAHFTPFHWVDAALAGKSKRAAHILRQLRLEAAEPMILLRSIQREVLQLLTLKRQMAAAPMRTLFDRHKVWQNRRPLLTQALGRLTLPQLRDAVALMTHIELALKQDYGYPVWSDLNALALLLCGKTLPAAMLDG